MKTRSERRQDEKAEDRQAPTGRVVYRAIYREGMEELSRDAASLAWSGLAAGLAMGASLIVEAVLRSHLPDTSWRPLVAKMGYGVGFLIIILGRQQLFTENTLTVVLPLLREKKFEILRNVLRLWSVVLAANLIGAFIFAAAVGRTSVFPAEIHESFSAIAVEAMKEPFW